MKTERSVNLYWLFQGAGWTMFAIFYFGTRLFIFPDVATRSLELVRFILALIFTFPLRAACRSLWLKKVHLVYGLFSCLFLVALFALAGELIAELFCRTLWNKPPTIDAGLVTAESTHFFVTLSCWCALYFTVKSYFEAEEQARQAMAGLLAQREAELALLRYQIQPEFFGRGLDRISSLIRDGNARQASVMTSQFGELLRSMLDQREIPLADLATELVHVGDYLRIILNQKDSTLGVDLDCDLEPNHILIPRWLLLPLVEATMKDPETTCRLRISQPGHDLLLELRVKTYAMQADSGLAVIDARLHEIFGDRASLISTFADRALDVEILMPLVCAIRD